MIGILPIRIETGRFETILNQQTGVLRKLNVNERTCNICSSGQTEDEFHFLFRCTMYDRERVNFYDRCNGIIPNFYTMTDHEKLLALMKDEWKYLSQFISTIWEIRMNVELL